MIANVKCSSCKPLIFPQQGHIQEVIHPGIILPKAPTQTQAPYLYKKKKKKKKKGGGDGRNQTDFRLK